jgi:hypothetical protein
LHEIVAIGSLEEPMSDPQHALQQGHDLAHELHVGGAVSTLGCAHQGRELFGFASGRRSRSQGAVPAKQLRAVKVEA